jgi:dUTP pyrophosphatase
MQKMKLKVQKLPHFRGELPAYQSAGASGFDVRAQLPQELTILPGQRKLIPTGLAFEIPLGFEIQVRPRSGLAIKNGISMVNTPGTIDADYRGEVQVILINHGQDPFLIRDQDRIAQFVLCPVWQADFELTENLSSTDRGAGGFGSTGVSIATEVSPSSLGAVC